jgi:phosphoribosyl 1,2-cyclic phosphate phosphodiesterase
VRLTLLGTGTSSGVPQVGCRCAVCCSADPRDRRTRTGALLEAGEATLLIDTPPELRLQLLAAGADRISAVLYTHSHADHVHGIDDLRMFSLRGTVPLPLYGSETTVAFLRSTYRYIFAPETAPPSGTSTPRLTLQVLRPGEPAEIAGIRILPLEFPHGDSSVLGFRIGPLGYVTDAKRVAPQESALLKGVDLLVLNALWWRPHPTHLSIPEAVEAARAIGAKRTILTHLTHETGHAELAARLPAGVEPGYDGQVLEIPV